MRVCHECGFSAESSEQTCPNCGVKLQGALTMGLPAQPNFRSDAVAGRSERAPAGEHLVKRGDTKLLTAISVLLLIVVGILTFDFVQRMTQQSSVKRRIELLRARERELSLSVMNTELFILTHSGEDELRVMLPKRSELERLQEKLRNVRDELRFHGVFGDE